jgi:TetR/AcrR family transcriptional regulator, mexJK operon transcriptional repressor
MQDKPSRSRKKDSERLRREPVTKTQLLDAALKEFVAHGFSKANVARIIAAVGGSRRNIYKHFNDKEGLFVAVVQELGSRTATERVTPERAGTLPPAEYLTLVATEYLRAAIAYEGLGLFRLTVAEGGAFPAIASALLASSGHEEIARNVAAYLEPRLADPARARGLADMFLSLARGDVFLRVSIDPRTAIVEQQIADQARDAVDLFLRGAGLT